ncbi:DUF5685 family protein [Bacillota bacterium Meth-B3]|nr:DUF5685 family protein [Christensenellaceae bacterium]MEA5065103.1 DUF5685 family protein [Eubacteriales bacterium]
MFGYVLINKETLQDAEVARFSAFYCGLCRALGQRYGALSQLALSYDMTFLALLLTSLYEPDTRSGAARCVAHPMGPRPYLENALIDYAADMTVVLAYHKALDDWRDDKSLTARTQSQLLKGGCARVEKLYPRQTQAVQRGLTQLTELERAGVREIDPPANAFGETLGELFVYRKDIWSDAMRQLGSALGRFIYLLDAYDDLQADRKKNRYNPLLGLADEPDFDARVKSYLTLLLGEGTVAFEQLPLVDDLGLLRNILYSGVWTRYEAIRRERGGKGANE